MTVEISDPMVRRLIRLAELPEQTRQKLGARLLQTAVMDLQDEDGIKKIAAVLSVDKDIVVDGLPVIVAIYHYAKDNEEGDIAKACAAIESPALTAAHRTALSDLARVLTPKIEELLQHLGVEAPTIPVPRFRRLVTRVISIGQFEPEFKPTQPTSEYLPSLVKRHTRLLLSFRVDDPGAEDSSMFSFSVQRSEVDKIINHLKLAISQADLFEKATDQGKAKR